MYHVVECTSTKTKEVDVVPENWIRNDGPIVYCYWPPYMNISRMKAAKSAQEPIGTTWKKYDVRILHTYDSFEKASSKISRALLTSDLTTDASDIEKAKSRKRRQKAAITSTDDSDNEIVTKKVNKKKAKKGKDVVTTLPKPPTAPRAIMSTEKNAAINQTTCNTVSCDEYDAFASLRSSQVYPIATPFADSNDSSATDDYIPVTSVATQSPNLAAIAITSPSVRHHSVTTTPATVIEQTNSLSSVRSSLNTTPTTTVTRDKQASSSLFLARSSASSNSIAVPYLTRPSAVTPAAVAREVETFPTRPSANTFEVRIMSELLEMKEHLQELTTAVNHQSQRLDQLLDKFGSNEPAQQFPEGINLPCTTMEQLHLLEAELVDNNELKSKLLHKLARAGGEKVQEACHRTMMKLLASSVAVQLNWTGKRHSDDGSKNKIAFSKMAVKAIVFDAIRRNPATCRATDAEMEKFISRWLRFSKDRDGGRQKRALEKAAKQRSMEENIPRGIDGE